MSKSNSNISEERPHKPSRRHTYSVGTREFDWRKSKDYPAPESDDLSWWAWEFLRRNRKYQDAYGHYGRFGGKEPSRHPIKDDDVLDTYFTHPKAPKGCTFREFQEMHADTRSTVLLWSEYVRRVWLLEEPIDPQCEYDERVQFVELHRRWKKNVAKKGRKDGEAMFVSGEDESFPFDYYTEVAPNEVLVRIRLYADDKTDIKRIAESLKKRVKAYRRRYRPLEYLSEMHVVLRLWDFVESSKGRPAHEKALRGVPGRAR